jgi:hypothetical protein
MKAHVLLALALTLLQSCRTSRATVEIQDANGPTKKPSPDYPNFGRSVQTTFAISAISLPLQYQVYEYLDLSLKRPGEEENAYSRKRYKPGESLTIEPNTDYDVVLTAMKGTVELYSTKFCKQTSRFRAAEGPNLFTASLCAKSIAP